MSISDDRMRNIILECLKGSSKTNPRACRDIAVEIAKREKVIPSVTSARQLSYSFLPADFRKQFEACVNYLDKSKQIMFQANNAPDIYGWWVWLNEPYHLTYTLFREVPFIDSSVSLIKKKLCSPRGYHP